MEAGREGVVVVVVRGGGQAAAEGRSEAIKRTNKGRDAGWPGRRGQGGPWHFLVFKEVLGAAGPGREGPPAPPGLGSGQGG